MTADDVAKIAGERVGPGAGYAGDLTACEAWTLLKEDPDAVLIDVRAQPEWAYVGVPDLSGIGKRAVFVSWQLFPTMQENPHFATELATRGVTPGQTAIFLCRSGKRSAAAARAMTAQGFARCYNLIDGFEGELDTDKHRGTLGGWKVDGLPWRQG